jgi:hypothetical protein
LELLTEADHNGRTTSDKEESVTSFIGIFF